MLYTIFAGEPQLVVTFLEHWYLFLLISFVLLHGTSCTANPILCCAAVNLQIIPGYVRPILQLVHTYLLLESDSCLVGLGVISDGVESALVYK